MVEWNVVPLFFFVNIIELEVLDLQLCVSYYGKGGLWLSSYHCKI
jgi:hypothetical protein